LKDGVISVRLSKQDKKHIEKLVKTGWFINKSDFIRHAIKKQLEQSRGGI